MTEKTTAAATEAKAPRAKKIQGYGYETRISYGSDAEGKRYDAEENTPKRGGAAKRFALYANVSTIQEALDAGMKPEDVGYDIKKGFIVAEKA